MNKEKCSCPECNNEPSFFHSKCCGVHFEGVILKDGTLTIACEKCGKYCATIQEGKK